MPHLLSCLVLEPNVRKVHVPYSLLISTALLQLDGVTLDNFAELKTVEGLKEGSLIKVSPILYCTICTGTVQ